MRLRAHHERREGPAASTFLAVLALPATALAQPRWHRGSKPQVTVYVEKTRVGATNWSYVKRSGIEWSGMGVGHSGLVATARGGDVSVRS